MKKLITLLLILSFGFIQAQDNFIHYLDESNFKKGIQKGVVVVEFNAPFNLSNSFSDWKQLEHCKYYRICVERSKTLQKRYKIYNYPTIVVFHNGYVERKYKGNIMLELEITTEKLQKAIDELYLDKF